MKVRYWLGAIALVLGMNSCQESDDTPEQYPDWQNQNEQAFTKIYNEALAAKDRGEDWEVVRGVMHADNADTENPTDYIVMEVLNHGYGDLTPNYTDTVTIHYAGKLLPSTRYANGLRFDASFYGESLDPDINPPYQSCVSSFIEGFSTALQYMHRGEYCRVYIPYQLAYGTAESGSIPAYSMLTFDIWMVDFWHKEQGDRLFE